MKNLQLIQVTPDELRDLIIEGIKLQLKELKEHFEPKVPNEYLSRSDLSKMLKVDLSTIHNWSKKGKLKSYGIGGRIYYKRSEVENAIIKIN